MIDVSTYCRDVEAYLCRRNGGHLIRVVGPAFDLVKGWAERGVPLAVVREAIDRTIDRASRATRRRRPIPITFCEGDVLDGFDRWRRAVGVSTLSADGTEAPPRRGTLAAHVERMAAHCAAWRGGPPGSPLAMVVTEVGTALRGLVASSTTARGAARDEIMATLAALDRRVVDAAEASLAPGRLDALAREAERELDHFRTRLDPAQWRAAVATTRALAVRREVGMPVLGFD